MSAQTKMQPEFVERLKRALDRTSWDHEFLARYVRELNLHRPEEFIFILLAFEGVGDGMVPGGGVFVKDAYSEWYAPLDDERKAAVRQWWHAKVKQEAERFDDLKTQLQEIDGESAH